MALVLIIAGCGGGTDITGPISCMAVTELSLNVSESEDIRPCFTDESGEHRYPPRTRSGSPSP